MGEKRGGEGRGGVEWGEERRVGWGEGRGAEERGGREERLLKKMRVEQVT